MQIAFLNPLWLLGLLALVPVLAHLFSRTRPRRRQFPSLLLLREALRHVTRVRRPRDRWLLLLRTLAMLAVALAMLQPWLFSRFGGAGKVKTVVLLIDVSASMGYVEGTRTRLASAAAAAEDILAALPTNSRANIVWAQAHPAAVLPEPAPNLEFLRQALRSAAVRPEAGSPAEALNVALRQLEEGVGERELVVVSDFQKSAWSSVSWQMPAQVRLTRIGVGESDGGNIALADLTTEPERPIAGEEARLLCRVRNFSGQPRRSTVYAQAGESRLSQAVEVAPWSETLMVLPVRFPAAGIVPLQASMTGDSFPADDVRYGVAEVRGALAVFIAAPTGDGTGEAWLRAAESLDHIQVRHGDLDALGSVGRPDVLLVAHWSGQGKEALRAQRARGGALLLQPASAGDASALLEEGAAKTVAADAVQQRDAPGWRTRAARDDHPLLALFAGGAFGDPTDGHFHRRVAISPKTAGVPVLLFEDGMTALSIDEAAGENAGNGPLALWNLDLGASDWPARPTYVSFFGELLHYLTRRAGNAGGAESEPGEPLRFDAGAALELRDVTLLTEADHALPLEKSGAQLSTTAAPPPGSYRWMAQGAVLSRAVVNFPERESDLRRLAVADLPQAGTFLAAGDRQRLSALREGRMLWPWALALAAACLLAEAILLARFTPREAAA